MTGEESRGRIWHDRKFILFVIAVVVIFSGIAWLGWMPGGGDTTRPAEAEGYGYFDFGSYPEDKVLVKFNDKWWWVNKTSEELELIGEDP